MLHSVIDGPAVFYLALPPGVFADAAETIAKAGLADESSGHRRLVIEKPFGTDLDTALALDEQLHRYWREDQIFRIDHFLGKETVQNILVFRFANRFIEPVLRAAHVDEIQITVAETLGVEGRSRYYDGIGALRDMIQNHLIQMMTFATMEPPALWDAEMIRDHKVEVLKAVRPVYPDVDAVRGQYTAGLVEGEPRLAYRAEPGVDPALAHRDLRRRCGCTSTRGGGKACRSCCGRASDSARRRTKWRTASASRRRACSGTRRSSTRSRTGSCSA